MNTGYGRNNTAYCSLIPRIYTTLWRIVLRFAEAVCCHPVAPTAKSSKDHSASGKFSNILPFCVYGIPSQLALRTDIQGLSETGIWLGAWEQWKVWGQVLRRTSLPWKEIVLRSCGYRFSSQGEDYFTFNEKGSSGKYKGLRSSAHLNLHTCPHSKFKGRIASQ